MERYVRRESNQDEYQRASKHHDYSHQASGKSRLTKKISAKEPHRSPPHAKLSKALVPEPLNEDSDYVQRWLAYIDGPDSHIEHERSLGLQHERARSRHTKPSRILNRRGQGEDLPSARKRKHQPSSDSSIIDVPIELTSRIERKDGKSTEKRREEAADDRKSMRLVSSEGSSSDPFAESSPQETFERRARHKTREDKYEPNTSTENKKKKKKKKKKKADGRTEQTSRKKKEKRKNDRRKSAKESGEDVMNKFSSKNIGQERLTIRPPQGLGLFNNGRASSPVRRGGLSDLAFSEMNFLQHSSRQPQGEKTSKASSKSRKKEKRKATRAQEEITEFFKPNRQSLDKGTSNRGRRVSSIRFMENDSIYAKQIEQGNRLQHYGDIGFLDSRERPLVGFRQTNPSSYPSSIYRSVSPVIDDPREHYRSTSKASEKATTYVSWSETQRSPPASSLRQTTARARTSTTPVSVRRSLENTGIFKDTGIRRNKDSLIGAYQPGAKFSPAELSEHIKYTEPQHKTAYSETTLHENSRPRPEEKRPTSSKERSNPEAKENRSRPRTVSSEDRQPQMAGNTRTRVIIEHFDPAKGWHEAPNVAPRCSSTDLPRESERTTINRQELGNTARIKRPATTLPLSRVPIQKAEQAHHSRVADETANDNYSRCKQAPVLPEESPNQYTREDNLLHEISPKHEEHTNIDCQMHALETNAPSEEDLKAIQQIPKMVPAEENSIRSIGSLSYLGLPVRGSWEPMQIDHNRPRNPSVEGQPYFLNQMQQQEYLLDDNGTMCQEITDYEIYNIPEEDFGQRLNVVEASEQVAYDTIMYQDVMLQDPAYYDEYTNVQQIFDSVEYVNGNNHIIDNHAPHNEYELLDSYDPAIETGQFIYEDNATLDEDFLDQELYSASQVIDEDREGCVMEAHDQTQGFWRPQTQY